MTPKSHIGTPCATNLSFAIDRDLDLVMLACFGGSERTAVEWHRLFSQADPRFVVKGIQRPLGSTMSVIEVVWKEGVEKKGLDYTAVQGLGQTA